MVWDYLVAAMTPVRPLGAIDSVSELKVDYPNGGQVRLYGADNPNALRGIYLDGVVLDEYADMHPRLYPEVIRPALADRGGWAVFIGTPKGHNDFHRIHEQARRDEKWLSLVLKASETGILRPAELEAARAELTEEQFAQEFECSFEAAIHGAYFAKGLAEAETQGRIGKVAADPLLPLRACFDIGGSGARADAMAIWIVQWAGREIRVLDYIEGVGQVLAYYVDQLRTRGYEKALCILPHDGLNHNSITGKTYETHIRDAGFETKAIPNQGAGAAAMRIEAARRLLPKCWFNDATTSAGREALIAYHEKRDEKRNIGLGPEHDWSSHASDAFGLMAIAYEEPFIAQERKRIRGRGGWMGG